MVPEIFTVNCFFFILTSCLPSMRPSLLEFSRITWSHAIYVSFTKEILKRVEKKLVFVDDVTWFVGYEDILKIAFFFTANLLNLRLLVCVSEFFFFLFLTLIWISNWLRRFYKIIYTYMFICCYQFKPFKYSRIILMEYI